MKVKQLLGTEAYISLCQPTGHAGRMLCSVLTVCSEAEKCWRVASFGLELKPFVVLAKSYLMILQQRFWLWHHSKNTHCSMFESLNSREPSMWVSDDTHWNVLEELLFPPQHPTPPLSTAKRLNHMLHCNLKTVTSMLMNHPEVILA